MDEKISQLPAKSSVNPADALPIVDSDVSPAVTKQVPVSVFDARYIAMAVALG